MAVQTEYWKSCTMPQNPLEIPQMAGSGAGGASRATSNSFNSFCPKKCGRKLGFFCLVSRRFGGGGGWLGRAVAVAAPCVGDKTNPTPQRPLVKKQKVEKNRKKLEKIKKKQLREHWGHAGQRSTELSRYSQWEIPLGSVDAPRCSCRARPGQGSPRPPHPRGAGRAGSTGAKRSRGWALAGEPRSGRDGWGAARKGTEPPGSSTARHGAPREQHGTEPAGSSPQSSGRERGRFGGLTVPLTGHPSQEAGTASVRRALDPPPRARHSKSWVL